MVLIVDHLNGSQEAGSETRHSLQREQQIWGCFSRLYPQVSFQLFKYVFPSLNMAGCTLARLDNISSSRLLIELSVKGDHPIDSAERHFDLFADVSQDCFGKEAVGILGCLEDGDERTFFVFFLFEDGV